jgi:hypothetical protein
MTDMTPTEALRMLDGPQPTRSDACLSLPVAITARDLLAKHFTDPVYLVDGVIGEGLTILGSRPKLGKSWMALDLAVAVAMGGLAFGTIPVRQCGVLSMALEDTERRLRDRLRTNLGGEPVPDDLRFVTSAPRMDQGGDAWLRADLDAHPTTKLVIIDTLAKFRAPVGRGPVYEADYAALGAIKAIADQYGISIMVVSHTTKNPALDDPIDAINGSSAITGAVDTILILKRQTGSADATLYVRGRDIEEADLALSQDRMTMQWAIIGTAHEAAQSAQRKRILGVLREVQPATPKEIADELDADAKGAVAIRRLLQKLLRDALITVQDGRYSLTQLPHTPHGNTGNGGNGGRGGNSGNGEEHAVTAVTGVPVHEVRRGSPGLDRWTQ